MTNLNYENQRLLDVVNENDEIIDAKSRIEIHTEGLLHREIHVWMFDKESNIIFQKRGLHARSANLLDATAGGHVNQTEDYLSAAVREIEEETSLVVSPDDLILLKKIRGKEDKEKELGAKINNFFRAVYIYKFPVELSKVKKEEGIPGGGFQKISIEFLNSLENDYFHSFVPFVLNEELPILLNYFK